MEAWGVFVVNHSDTPEKTQMGPTRSPHKWHASLHELRHLCALAFVVVRVRA